MRPHGWVMTLIVSGTRVQKTVCHDTSDKARDGADVL
jgi:hypothetical protein